MKKEVTHTKKSFGEIRAKLEDESNMRYSHQDGRMGHVFKAGGETVIVRADAIRGGYNVHYIPDDAGAA